MYEDLRSRNLRDVLSVLGFSDWKERKGGAEWFGRCPVHKPKANNSSFSYDATGRFNCFSCRISGRGAIDLTMAVRGCGFQEAVEFLRSNLGNIIAQGATRPQVRQLQVQPTSDAPTENKPYEGKYEKFAVDSPWLKERSLTAATLSLYEVFQYNNPARRSAYSGSVMLKIRRYSDGACVGYLSRNIGEITPEKPKYVFPKGFHKGLELFGAWQIKNSGQKLPLRVAFLVESPFAVMAFHQKGLPAVSPFGWSLSDEQVALLEQIARGWIYLPDRNKYAEIGESVRKLAIACWVTCPALPPGIDDPEHLSAEQIRALA